MIQRTNEPRRFRWPARLAARLGRIPDTTLAALAGLSPLTVAHERRRRGLAPFKHHRPLIEWTQEMLARLGRDSDASVAAGLGVHRGSVLRMRRILGIPAFRRHRRGRPQFNWTRRALALLGHASDAEVARRLGLSRSAVVAKRQTLGVASSRPAPTPTAWNPEIVGLLGRLPDTEIARRFRIGSLRIKRKREDLGIAPHRDKRIILAVHA